MSEDHVVEVLTEQECLGVLAAGDIGRLCVLDRGVPVAFPVNYRLVPDDHGGVAIVVRARRDGVLDQAGAVVGFQVDGVDRATAVGSAWSVIARGTLHHADDPALPPWIRSFDPRPWIADRDAWLAIVVGEVSGRRLMASVLDWAFSIRGYL